MGWLLVVMWESLNSTVRQDSFTMLALGGMLYVIGVVFFVLDDIRMIPAFHVIWHFFVLLAAICHYVAIRCIIQDYLTM
jgi:hemolysin III